MSGGDGTSMTAATSKTGVISGACWASTSGVASGAGVASGIRSGAEAVSKVWVMRRWASRHSPSRISF